MEEERTATIRWCEKSGGCGAKFEPQFLQGLFNNLRPIKTSNVLVGVDTLDDAGVYKLTDELAQIHTADVITPVTTDPYMFGQVAAANALSDIYAMGGRAATALNLCFFPEYTDTEALYRILEGGLDKCVEAGADLIGGHTVRDEELKYGLAVTGIIHPQRIITNGGARIGDKLILTKPIGSGVFVSAARQNRISSQDLKPVVDMMAALNKRACEIMIEYDVHACTDITGFGLAGHALELARGSNLGVRIFFATIPVFAGTIDLIMQGESTSITNKNRRFVESTIRMDAGINSREALVLFDPQTSGGLLIAVPSSDADDLLWELHKNNVREASIIGECVPRTSYEIDVHS